jgi:hypothetical protein
MKQFYVYIHKKPDGTPFYVGKGHGDRAYKLTWRNPHHQAVLDKYKGQVIIEITNCENEQAAFELEKIYIKQLRDQGYRLCNRTDGGEGVCGLVVSQQSREKMSLAKLGKTQSQEQIQARVQGMIGRKMSAGYSEKLSKRWKGVPKPLEHCKKISITLTGTKDTEERKQNKSRAAIGKAKARNTSGLCGVSWNKQKQAWDVRMKKQSIFHRKRFACLLDAAAYQFALQREINLI